MPDAKELAALIVGGPPPGPPGDSVGPPEVEDSGDMGLQAAAEDLLAAVGSKDSRAIAAALKAAFEMLEAKPHGEAETE